MKSQLSSCATSTIIICCICVISSFSSNSSAFGFSCKAFRIQPKCSWLDPKCFSAKAKRKQAGSEELDYGNKVSGDG